MAHDTTAEQIAARFHGDGQCWTDDNGKEFDAECSDACVRCEWRDGFKVGDTYRYEFVDGSVITVAGDGWDFGYPDCYCWRGAGHTEECQVQRSILWEGTIEVCHDDYGRRPARVEEHSGSVTLRVLLADDDTEWVPPRSCREAEPVIPMDIVRRLIEAGELEG